jgi:hypothetical protein
MTDVPHGNLAPGASSGIHVPCRWSVANQTARLALSLSTADVTGFCFQQDTKETYQLLNNVGPVWARWADSAVEYGFRGTRVISGDDTPTTADKGKLMIVSAAANSNQTINSGLLGAGEVLSYLVRGVGVPTFVQGSSTLVPRPGKGLVTLGKGSVVQLIGTDVSNQYGITGDFADAVVTYPGIDPATIGSLVLDWDPHIVGKVATGATFNFTDNKSAHIRTQATGTAQPALITADAEFNGFNSLLHDGGDYTIDTAAASFYKFMHGAPMTVFVVARQTASGVINSTNGAILADCATAAGSRGFEMRIASMSISNGTAFNLAGSPFSGTTLAGQQSFYQCVAWDGTASAGALNAKQSTMTSWTSLAPSGSIDTTNDPAAQMYYGSNSSPTRNIAGKEARLLIFNAKLDQATRDGIITHLVAKYGLVA